MISKCASILLQVVNRNFNQNFIFYVIYYIKSYWSNLYTHQIKTKIHLIFSII